MGLNHALRLTLVFSISLTVHFTEISGSDNSQPFVPCKPGWYLFDNVTASQRPPSSGWKCPDSSNKWLDLEGEFCYYIESRKFRTWIEAIYECGRIGGTLASFHSDEETNNLHPHVSNTGLWIGLKKSPGNKDFFEWADGTEFNYQNWILGYPFHEGFPLKGCVKLWPTRMKWIAAPCNTSNGYICKSKKVFSKMEETSTPVPCSCAVSMDQSCSGGIPVGAVVGIVFCTVIIVLLIGVIVYYSPNFWKRYYMKTENDCFTSTAQGLLDHVSDKVIWKPLK